MCVGGETDMLENYSRMAGQCWEPVLGMGSQGIRKYPDGHAFTTV